MRESAAMLEIRKIRDENSLRYLKLTSEELSKELDDSMKWFIKALGRDVKVISSPSELRN